MSRGLRFDSEAVSQLQTMHVSIWPRPQRRCAIDILFVERSWLRFSHSHMTLLMVFVLFLLLLLTLPDEVGYCERMLIGTAPSPHMDDFWILLGAYWWCTVKAAVILGFPETW